jgi:hypothetical protein
MARPLEAPFGFRLISAVDADDEEAVLALCLNFAGDSKVQDALRNDTHQQRLQVLFDMGFEVNNG